MFIKPWVCLKLASSISFIADRLHMVAIMSSRSSCGASQMCPASYVLINVLNYRRAGLRSRSHFLICRSAEFPDSCVRHFSVVFIIFGCVLRLPLVTAATVQERQRLPNKLRPLPQACNFTFPHLAGK